MPAKREPASGIPIDPMSVAGDEPWRRRRASPASSASAWRRTPAAGKDWCRLSVGVGEGDELTWVSVAVFEEKARALAALTKGAEVYVEGRLTMNTWEGKDGQPRTGLSVSAWRVEILGRIGMSRPAKAPKHSEEFDNAIPF